jgi:hypothetical protein
VSAREPETETNVPKLTGRVLGTCEQATRAAEEAALAAELVAAEAAGNTPAVENVMERALTSGYTAEASAASGILAAVDQKAADLGNLMAACRTLDVKLYSRGEIDRTELQVVQQVRAYALSCE